MNMFSSYFGRSRWKLLKSLCSIMGTVKEKEKQYRTAKLSRINGIFASASTDRSESYWLQVASESAANGSGWFVRSCLGGQRWLVLAWPYEPGCRLCLLTDRRPRSSWKSAFITSTHKEGAVYSVFRSRHILVWILKVI